jgi:hypothetical protein
MTTRSQAREYGYIGASLALIALLLGISYDAAIIASAFLVFLFGLLFRPGSLKAWIPALLITGIWIMISGNMYEGYNVFKLKIGGLTLFPIIAWPTGLMAGYLLAVPHIRISPWLLRWLVLGSLYSLGVIAMEWFGYNLLGVHLDRGLAYPGWPILNIFHCPAWMQVAYFANGILFMGAIAWLERNKEPPARKPPTPRGGPAGSD